MDRLSLIGLIVAIGSLLIGQHLEGGHIQALLNGPAFIIVFGGTLGAVLLETPPSIFRYALRMTKWIHSPPQIDLEKTIEKIVHWSTIARKEGLLGLESVIAEADDEFSRKGLQLLVDGAAPESIHTVMTIEIDNRALMENESAKMFESMGGYAPTIGILGAVLGLIHVMTNLADPSAIGPGIAVAFVATIYGVGFANLIFLPIANKLKKNLYLLDQYRDLVMRGILAIAEGENPRMIELKLKGFIEQDEPGEAVNEKA